MYLDSDKLARVLGTAWTHAQREAAENYRKLFFAEIKRKQTDEERNERTMVAFQLGIMVLIFGGFVTAMTLI